MTSLPGSPVPDGSLAEAIQRSLAESSTEFVWTTDREGVVTWCNAACERHCGLRPGDDVATLASRAEAALQALRMLWHEAERDADLHTAELSLVRDDGAAWVLALQVVGANDTLLWVGRDTSAVHTTRRRNQRLLEKLVVAQDFGGFGVWSRELPSQIGHWDPRVFHIYGRSPTPVAPSREEFQTWLMRDGTLPIYDTSSRQSGTYLTRFRVRRPDGEVRRIRTQWRVKTGSDGAPRRAVGITVDESAVDEPARATNSAAQLSLAVDLVGMALWRHDLKTDRVYFNERGFELIGLPYRAKGLSMSELNVLVHPDDRRPAAEAPARALQENRPIDTELRFRHADGSWRRMLVRRVVERAPWGEPLGFVGVSMDITSQVEHGLRAQRLNTLIDSATRAAGLGLWTTGGGTDSPGEWNAVMFELFDMDPAPVPPAIYDWLINRVHPLDQSRVDSELRRHLRTPAGPIELEFRIVRRDGQVRWMVLRGDVSDAGQPGQRVFGIVMDVTERHEAQEALRTANERSALIARHAGIGTWESNADGSAAVWDEQMYWLRGLDPRVTKLSWDERMALLHPDDRARVLESHPRLEDDAQPRSYEFRVRWPDGSEHWLASRSAVWRDADGRVGKRVGVNWDITEAKAAEATRQQALLTERASQAKSQFLSRMSHELRTPLNAVLGFTQLLQLEGGARASEKLGHIRQAGEHLLRLIDDALDLSALEAGKLKLEPQEVGVAQAVRQALGLVTQMAQERGVALREAGLEGRVWADPTRLRQVLLNLLSNGIKYNRPAGEVWVSAREAGDWVGLEVGDTGLGMTPEQLAHLFEPFNRLGRHQAGIQGSGIGLTVVKGLVENMGGHIEVRSQPQHGTVFSLRLPRAAAVDPASPD